MIKTVNTPEKQIGQGFVERHRGEVIGVLHGWDRLRLQGSMRSFYYEPVMDRYLREVGVLLKGFKSYAESVTGRVCQAAERLAEKHKRPQIYIGSSRVRKEAQAREIQERDKIKRGLIAVMSSVEPCRTWKVRGNRASKKLEVKVQWGKCLHYYFYWMHGELGFMHLRLQTWFPFLIQLCVNGREWLGQQMDKRGMKYRREANCFTWIAELKRAQGMMDEQAGTDWRGLLSPIVEQCHPLHKEINRPFDSEYYWTVGQSEYAVDVMFRNRGSLTRVYPGLVHHAMMHMGAEQVLRFMGRPGRPGIHDEVQTDQRRREEGVRVKHWVNKNSLKFYDKGSVLRSEVTINEPKDFRVWRRAENDPAGKLQWRILRRSVADFERRAEVSRAATDRHLTALAAVEIQSSLGQEAAGVCRAVKRDRKRYRALNPLAEGDAAILAIVNRGEFAINGFRNRDVRVRLYRTTQDRQPERRQMAAVGRQLRLLRAHGLIHKVSKTHRYVVTEKGRRIITALLAARHASTEKLTALAA